MPRNVAIEASQSGLIGETSIDIIPQASVPTALLTANPLAADCDNQKDYLQWGALGGADRRQF